MRKLSVIILVLFIIALPLTMACIEGQGSCQLIVDFADPHEYGAFVSDAFSDRYTRYVPTGPGGMQTTSGSNGAYFYAGANTTISFTDQTIIYVHWYNGDVQTQTFSPLISFDDPDRRSSGVVGTWRALSQVSIPPGELHTSTYIINGFLSPLLINVNTNSDEATSVVVLDKITYETSSGCSFGDVRNCNTGLFGICSTGTQECDDQNTWGYCSQNESATTEICANGKDDDCDNQIDEGCASFTTDINGDNNVDMNDYYLINSDFGTTYSLWHLALLGSDFNAVVFYCGDGNCNALEDCFSCSSDCGTCGSVCGDGIIDVGEHCDNGTSNNGVLCTPSYGSSCTYCSSGCVIEQRSGGYCGDTTCDPGYEDEGSCVVDCHVSGSQADFTVRAPGMPMRWWDDHSFHQTELGYVRPEPLSGDFSSPDSQGESFITILRGSIDFGVYSDYFWSSGGHIPVTTLRYRLVLHRPDANGVDTQTALSGILTGQQTMSWDTTTVPDGTYALSIDILGAGTGSDAVDQYKGYPITIVVDNTPGAISGAQWIPTTGLNGMRTRWSDSFTVDWIRTVSTPLLPTANTYPYTEYTAPTTAAGRNALVGDDTFFPENWLQGWNARYDKEGRISKTQDDHIFIDSSSYRLSDDNNWKYYFPFTDGSRNQASINKHTSFRPIPTGPGFYGLSIEGRLFRITPAEGVVTLAGIVTRSDLIPFHPGEKYSVDRESLQWDTLGDFGGEVIFDSPEDFVLDPNNPLIMYVSDTRNDAIRQVDISTNPAIITTYAGQVGSPGNQNGDRLSARFDNPWGIEIIGNTMYVSDNGNDALRRIDMITGQVSTASTAPTNPYWLRQLSDGTLAILDEGDYGGGGNIRIIDPQSGNFLRTLSSTVRGFSFDVDYLGNIGPVDDVLAAGNFINSDDHGITRITQTGEKSFFSNDAGVVSYQNDGGLCSAGCGSTYSISVGIDDDEARLIQTGQYQWGVRVYRPLQPSDPISIDTSVSSRGRDHYYAGTIREFYPNKDRSSLSAFHGRKGHNYIGQLLFDDMISWSNEEIADYIASGMGSSVARPELTGRDLASIIYFIRVHSLQGQLEHINPQVIAQDVQAAGYWNDLEDVAIPTIMNVNVQNPSSTSKRITFTTSEPTVAVIHYGRSQYLGMVSHIADQYSTSHDITIVDLDPAFIDEYNIKIRVKDQAGNQAILDI